MDIAKGLATIAAITASIWFGMTEEVKYDTHLHPNAPAGAVEYFENDESTSSVTLFEDRIVTWIESGLFAGEHEISLSDVKGVTKIGYRFEVRGSDGSRIEFNLFNPKYAKQFKASLDEQMKLYPYEEDEDEDDDVNEAEDEDDDVDNDFD